LDIKAKFEIPYLQFSNDADLLSHEQIRHYFKTMLLIRQFDKKAISLQRTGRMGTYAPVEGHEAIGTAIGINLQENDVFIPYYRDYATMYLRGVPLSDIFSYWGGDERGNQFSQQSHDFSFCVPIASQCQHAVGVGYALSYQNSSQVVVVTIGDGGTSEGDFYEAINAAGVWNLPVVFVIINNQWAISVPRSAQTKCETLAQKAIAAGIEGIQVDGNDIFALHQVLSEKIAHARGPNGKPCVIEAICYRLSDHTTADDATRYQDKDEVSKARQQEAITKLQDYILSHHIMTQADIEQMIEACKQEVELAANAYLSRKPQDIREVFDHHFDKLPNYLIEQRAQAIEEFLHAHD
jgi:2-oxoisovalerate dehydrogenase E1 component alpha subunit